MPCAFVLLAPGAGGVRERVRLGDGGAEAHHQRQYKSFHSSLLSHPCSMARSLRRAAANSSQMHSPDAPWKGDSAVVELRKNDRNLSWR